MYAQVIVDIAHSQVDRIFEYSCPDGLNAGSRVKVPFGGRVIEGFVISVSDRCSIDPAKVKPIAGVFDEVPALVPECLSLVERISERFRTPKAAALRLFVPSEMRLGKVSEAYKTFVIPKNTDYAFPKSAKKQAEAAAYLKEHGECELTPLCEKFGRSAVNALRDKGVAEFERREVSRVPFSDEEGKEQPKQLT